ncbi:hypothetical protein ILUMI_13609 [Ignelater luminosus]|uniref:Uncharacterized protein n=1 Tax=Ignelater luminosus TaxID=2038154 RepID=A0A8K0CWD9_IGNLU|nr:hypothetical protein ILUMI_13609 [Ignelater luminosus]
MYEIIRRMNQDVSVKYVFPRQKACDGFSSQPRPQQTKITIANEEIEEIILTTLENAKKDCEQLGISVIENSWNTLILLKSVSTTEIDEELEDGHMHVLGESVVSVQIDSLVAYENNSRIEEIKDKPDGGISENTVKKINIYKEMYYAVYYNDTWYIGRVLDIGIGRYKTKFLKENLGNYIWPKKDDVQEVEEGVVFERMSCKNLIVSAERGELATLCGIVTATGAAFPPVHVFPRVNFKEHFLNGAPEGSLGKTLSIYNIAELSKLALLESFTPKNITSGFSKPRIWTFNRLAFDDDDFAPIEIFGASSQDVADENRRNKDRHEVNFVEMEISQNDDAVENCEEDEIPVVETDPLGNRSDVVASPNVVPSGSTLILPPESVRTYPKKVIDEKTSSKKEREKGKSRVFTDSSKRDRLRKLYEEKERKQQIQIMKQRARELKMARNLLDLKETKKIKKK